jgi:hypothetical protein
MGQDQNFLTLVQMETHLAELCVTMEDVAQSLREISAKLNANHCIYDIDDVVSAINTVGATITGPMGISLEDIHNQLLEG